VLAFLCRCCCARVAPELCGYGSRRHLSHSSVFLDMSLGEGGRGGGGGCRGVGFAQAEARQEPINFGLQLVQQRHQRG
jgi:hypothetical protein